MSEWVITRTDTFLKHLRKLKHHQDLLQELDKKIHHLKEYPEKIGGFLAGSLHGSKATRLTGKYRLIFTTDGKNRIVYLIALDHRGRVYE